MNKKIHIFHVLVLATVFLLAASAHAQLNINWFTVVGGGGTSSGGSFTVTGSIGRPDAGVVSGGQFTLRGGFWPGLVVPSTSEAPTLFIQFSGDSVIISWLPSTPGFELETTVDLAGAVWTPAPPGNPVTILVAGQTRFFRLKKP
jgi:hypothetical protein